MNLKQIEKIKNIPVLIQNAIYTEAHKAIKKAVRSFSAAVAITLHDKYGWGAKKINRFLLLVQSQFECCLAGTVKVEELEKAMEDYGIYLGREK